MLVFVEGGKLEKNSQIKAGTNNKLNSHMAPGQIQTRATFLLAVSLLAIPGVVVNSLQNTSIVDRIE